MSLKKIFLRKAIEREVTEVHASIHKAAMEHTNKVLDGFDMTLLDFLVLPVSRTIAITHDDHVKIANALMHPSDPDWSSFKVYNMPEIGVMQARRKFVQKVIDEDLVGELRSPMTHGQEISTMSLLTENPSVHLAMKYFCLHWDRPYSGLPAMTSPARTATKVLFGTEFHNLLEAKECHTQLAMELDRDELWVNSALWVLGNRIKNQ